MYASALPARSAGWGASRVPHLKKRPTLHTPAGLARTAAPDEHICTDVDELLRNGKPDVLVD